MILPDVNLLLNAYNRDFPDHAAAKAWWEGVLNSGENVALAWESVLGFLRIMTNPRVMPNPLPLADAIAAVEAWLAVPTVDWITPGPCHAEILFRLLRQAGVAGDLTTDAHLAALAIEHRARLASTDTDFARFPGLRWFNPLESRRTR